MLAFFSHPFFCSSLRYPVSIMSGWSAFFRVSSAFHPTPPASTSLCGMFNSFFSSKNASIRVGRFFLGSIVPRFSIYGASIFGSMNDFSLGFIPA